MRTAAMDDYFFNEIKSHPVWRFPIFFLAGEALRRPARFCTDLGKRESPFKFDLRYNAKR